MCIRDRDLPDLLALYERSGGADPKELQRALDLMAQRLERITKQLKDEQQREFQVRREYLEGKYASDLLDK